MPRRALIITRLLVFHGGDRHLDDGEPLLGVFLVPCAVHIHRARMAGDAVVVFIDVAEYLYERVITCWRN